MVDVERAGPKTWGRVRAVRLRALRDAPDAFWTTVAEAEATTPDAWQERLRDSDAATFLASSDGVDVGMVFGGPHHVDADDAGLYGMWVAPDARGTAAATRLVEALVDWTRAVGYRRIRLDVADDNEPAIRLYARLGFEPTGVTSAFPPPRDHVVEHERARQLQ